MSKIIIKKLCININGNNGAANHPLAGLLAAIMSAAPGAHDDHHDDTPLSSAPATAANPVDDQPTQGMVGLTEDWPAVGDRITFFDSAKNHFKDTADTAMDDVPEVIEVTDDWFRVEGVFTSKTGKGTRNVTLKVSRDEVANGAVKYAIN